MKQIVAILSVIIFIIVFITLFFVTGNIRVEQEGVKYLIGLSFSNLSEIEQTSIYNAIIENAEKDSEVNVVTTNASGSVYTQIKDLKKLQDLGVDAMLVCADDVLVIRNEIASYYGEIPIVILEKSISGYDYDLYFGIDNYELGYNAGHNIVEVMDGQSGTVVEIKDEISMRATQECSKGFLDAINDNSNVQLFSFYLTSNGDKLDEKLKSLFSNYNNIKAVFSHDMDIAIRAKEISESMDVGNIYFSTFSNENYANRRGIEHLQKLDGIYSYNYYGSQIMLMIKDLIENNQTMVKKNILNTILLTSENHTWYVNGKDNSSVDKKTYSDDISVGYVGNGVVGEYNKFVNDLFTHYFKKERIDYISYMLTDTDSKIDMDTAQAKAVSELIEKDVDIIFLTPYGSKKISEYINKAKLNGIKVVLIDEPLSYAEQISCTYIGTDGYDEGKLAAEWIVDHIYSNTDDISLAEIKAREDVFSTYRRESGFGNVINGYLRIEEVESVYGDCSYESGAKAMQEIIDHNSNVNLLYVHNQEMALGAVDVIKQNGLIPGKDIKIIINKGLSKSEKLLELGEVNCIIKPKGVSAEYITNSFYDIYGGYYSNKHIIIADDVIMIEN